MADDAPPPPKVPPRWFVHVAWRIHRALYRLSGGRFLWTPTNKRGSGTLRLTTVGRRSGTQRAVIVGYLEDGPDRIVLAMNGWGEGHPSWWWNLREHPDATVRESHGPERPVHAREAVGPERDRLWEQWRVVEPQLDDYAGRRGTETPVVVLEPRDRTG